VKLVVLEPPVDTATGRQLWAAKAEGSCSSCHDPAVVEDCLHTGRVR